MCANQPFITCAAWVKLSPNGSWLATLFRYLLLAGYVQRILFSHDIYLLLLRVHFKIFPLGTPTFLVRAFISNYSF